MIKSSVFDLKHLWFTLKPKDCNFFIISLQISYIIYFSDIKMEKKKKKLKYLPCCSYLRHFWRKYCRLSFLPLCFTFPSCALPFNIFSSLLYPCSQSREVKVSHILFSECCSFAWPLPLLITVMSVFSNYDQPFLFFQSNSYFTEFQIYKTCVILAKT